MILLLILLLVVLALGTGRAWTRGYGGVYSPGATLVFVALLVILLVYVLER